MASAAATLIGAEFSICALPSVGINMTVKGIELLLTTLGMTVAEVEEPTAIDLPQGICVFAPTGPCAARDTPFSHL